MAMDHPHRTSAKRWFVYCHVPDREAGGMAEAIDDSSPTPCSMHAPLDVACFFSLRSWARRHGLPVPEINADHESWLAAEHCRCAHRSLRVLRRVEDGEVRTKCESSTQSSSSRETNAATATTASPGKGKKRKNKGLLYPGGAHADGSTSAPLPLLSEQERQVAKALRLQLLPHADATGSADPFQVPSLATLLEPMMQQRVLRAMHGE